MSKLPLIEGVLKYARENNISFCMPGHKNGKGFLNTEKGKNFIENILKCDITEVEGVDNLHNAEGIIKKAQDLLTHFYESYRSYFLVNGSTSGNLIMIFSSFKEGDKVIVDRNCHKSIFNAIILKKLKPVYVRNKISDNLNAPISINMEHLFNVMENNKDAKGIIVTYPNYYGICFNLKEVIKNAKKYEMKVLVDSAHGAHFGVNDKLPQSAVKLGADMVVTSAHKTLPSLTQTAFLHINNREFEEKVNFYFSSFLSTSPSYLLMCSMDYARYYLEVYGKNDYENLIKLTEKYKIKINNIPNLHVINDRDMEKGYFIDKSRYIIHLNENYNANLLLKYLRKNKIQSEMSDTHNLVLIFSTANKEEEFIYLYNVLKKCDFNMFKFKGIKIKDYDIPKSGMDPYKVLDREKVLVNIDKGLGKISGKNIVPYPPGIPLVMMGEIIDKETIDMIKYYLISGTEVMGIYDNKISIVK